MDDESKMKDLKPVLRVLTVIEVLLLVFLIFTIADYKQGRTDELEDYVQPAVIVNILNSVSEDGADYDVIVSRYFDVEADSVEFVKTKLMFDYIFRPAGEKCYSCEIVRSAPNYVEALLRDEHGSPLYPKVAFGYKLNEDESKVIDYSFARLQPFSRRHKEYDLRWSK